MTRKEERLTAELKLRLPERLRKQIEVAAKARFDGKGQSLNEEMIERLQRSFGRGLLDELLQVAYGPTTAGTLMEAHKQGMLRIKDKHIEVILARVRKFLEHIQKGEAAP